MHHRQGSEAGSAYNGDTKACGITAVDERTFNELGASLLNIRYEPMIGQGRLLAAAIYV